MSNLKIYKYQGLGNDFIILEGDGKLLPEAQVRALCDRRFGVGADGVLHLWPAQSAGAHGTMVIQNADGSRPEMCGNGLRCVAAHLAQRAGKTSLSAGVDTDAGCLQCEVEGSQVRIAMGQAKFEGAVTLQLEGQGFELERVSMGNPHAITFEPFDDQVFQRFGLPLATHPTFPEGSNIEFARVLSPQRIDLKVWERGVGPTLACGTGACATAALACRLEKSPRNAEVEVNLPGGKLVINIDDDDFVLMRGPAVRVFEAEVAAEGLGA